MTLIREFLFSTSHNILLFNVLFCGYINKTERECYSRQTLNDYDDYVKVGVKKLVVRESIEQELCDK